MVRQGLTWDEDALERFLGAVAGGVDDWAQEEAVPAVYAAAPKNTGRYRRSLHATTFFRNRIVGGRPIRGGGVKSKADIWTLIYTTSKIGHLLERGTQARDVPKEFHGLLMVWKPDKYGPGGAAFKVHQPAMAARPHFGPGILRASRGIARKIAEGTQRRLGTR